MQHLWIGLDQSLSNTGVAITDLKTIATTVFKTSDKYVLTYRLNQIERYVQELVETYDPQMVFIEAIYPQRNLDVYRKLVAVEIIIKNCLYKNNKEYWVAGTSPKDTSGWPYNLGLQGTKKHLSNWIVDKLPNKISEHEVDAIGILWGSLVYNGVTTPEKIFDTEIVNLNESNKDRLFKDRQLLKA